MRFLSSCLRAFVVGLAFFPALAFAEPMGVPESPAPIRVDGHLETWPEARMFLLDKKDQVVQGKILWKGSDDFNGRVFLTYDDHYLYLAAIVKKSSSATNDNLPANLWNGDCLEVFLSTDPGFKNQKGPSRGDYHLGFSPGTACRNPQMFCFNKNSSIPSGRVIARAVKTGYILEAAVPLEFFAGLQMGPGKSLGFNLALDRGGAVGGYRTIQMDYSGAVNSWENPSLWQELTFSGQSQVSIPPENQVDVDSRYVLDGTQDSTFAGMKDLKGRVLDPNGKPLAGAVVGTWPKTEMTVTDPSGFFQLPQAKTYDSTLVYARADGYISSLQKAGNLKKPLEFRLSPLPEGFQEKGDQVGNLFWGSSLRGQDLFSSGKGLRVLKLSGLNSDKSKLDSLLASAKAAGLEPVLEIPLPGMTASQAVGWVRYCNVEKKYGVHLWALGDEPDGNLPKPGDPTEEYGIYDYVNDFRAVYNALKAEDPTLVLMGPELGSKTTLGNDDWLSAFLKYDGDIVDVVSLHRYGVLKAKDAKSKAVLDSLRRENTLLQNFRDKIAENSGRAIPLAITGGSVCAEPVTDLAKDGLGPLSIWPLIWQADEDGMLLKNHVSMACFSLASGGKGRFWMDALKGRVLPVQVLQPDVTAYATQDPTTKDVSLLIINGGNRYYNPKIQLDNHGSDIMVDAGLSQKYDFEIPSYSIALLVMRADRGPGWALLQTPGLVEAGGEPHESVLKPW